MFFQVIEEWLGSTFLILTTCSSIQRVSLELQLSFLFAPHIYANTSDP